MTQDIQTKNRQLVEALFDATGKGDWAAAESMLTSDFTVTEAATLPFAGTYHGRRALQELFTFVMSAAGVTRLDIQKVTAGGDRVVALLEMVLGGPPEVRVALAQTFRVRDGKVCEIRPYYFDPRPVAAAIEARKRAATT
jgi:ketosteroid isomerase-like protein